MVLGLLGSNSTIHICTVKVEIFAAINIHVFEAYITVYIMYMFTGILTVLPNSNTAK